MKKIFSISIFLPLLFILLTVSSASSQVLTDSITSYNKPEAVKIAATLIKGDKCFKDRSADSSIIIKLNGNITDLKGNIIDFQKGIEHRESIIKGKEAEIQTQKDNVVKEQRTIKWIKAGWLATTTALCGVIALLILH